MKPEVILFVNRHGRLEPCRDVPRYDELVTAAAAMEAAPGLLSDERLAFMEIAGAVLAAYDCHAVIAVNVTGKWHCVSNARPLRQPPTPTLPGRVVTLVTGRSSDITHLLRQEAAPRDNQPLLQPALDDSEWPVWLYFLLYAWHVLRGDEGSYVEPWLYINKRRFWEYVGLDRRTIRAGWEGLTSSRDCIRGVLDGHLVEYRGRVLLTRVILVDKPARLDRRVVMPCQPHPLYWQWLKKAFYRPSVDGGVLYVPKELVDGLYATARRARDGLLAGLTEGAIDVIRNRYRRVISRRLPTLARVFRVTTYKGLARKDAITRKIEILGQAGFLERYEMSDDHALLYPATTLGVPLQVGENGLLFADEHEQPPR